MSSAQDTFISTTYHTERLGPVAALATLRKFQRCDVQRVICERGASIKQKWAKHGESSGLPLTVGGWDSWPNFGWGTLAKGADALLLTSLFTQEMLARGFLANTVVAVSFAHTEEVLALYHEAAEEVFKQIAAWVAECGGAAEPGAVSQCVKFLEGPVRHGGFHRV